jgi:hypothetical protein
MTLLQAICIVVVLLSLPYAAMAPFHWYWAIKNAKRARAAVHRHHEIMAEEFESVRRDIAMLEEG